MAFQIGLPVQDPSAQGALRFTVVNLHVFGETVQEGKDFAADRAAVLLGPWWVVLRVLPS